MWWTVKDSNLGSAGYEPDAVTISANSPNGAPGWARTNDRPLIRQVLKPTELLEHFILVGHQGLEP